MLYYVGNVSCDPNYLEHHGIKGQKWGVRRFQNADGSLTANGRIRYGFDRIGTALKRGVKDQYEKRSGELKERTKSALDFWGHDYKGRTKTAAATLVAGCIQRHGLKIATNMFSDAATYYAANTGRLWVINAANTLGKVALAANTANIAIGVAASLVYKEPKSKKKNRSR